MLRTYLRQGSLSAGANQKDLNNFFIYMVIVALSVSGITNLLIGLKFIGFLILLFGAYFVLVYYLNRKVDDRWIFGSIILSVNSIIFYLDGYFGEGAGIHLYYLLIILTVPTVIKKTKNKFNLIFYMVTPAVGLTISILTSHQLFLNETISAEKLKNIYWVNLIVNALIFEFLVLYMVFKNSKSNVNVDKSNAKIRALLENNDLAICILNRNYQLVESNTNFDHLYEGINGLKPETNENFFTLVGGRELTLKWVKRFHLALNGQIHHYLENIVIKKRKVVLDVTIFPIVVESKVTGVAIFCKDVTHQKNSEDKLKTQNQELKKLNEELDQFVYSASHDLRSPISSLLGLVDVAKKENKIQRIRECLDLQEKTLLKLDLFVHDIIDYSKNSRLGLDNEKVNIRNLIGEAIDLQLFNENAGKIIATNIKVDGQLPLYTDKKRLSIVFNNLISNAIRYRSKKSPRLDIEVLVDKEKAQIIVNDNGVGIEQGHLDKIYNMFYQASANNHGPGLGLYIVKETVSKLQGQISVSSKFGIGTKFKVTIPNQISLVEAESALEKSLTLQPVALSE